MVPDNDGVVPEVDMVIETTILKPVIHIVKNKAALDKVRAEAEKSRVDIAIHIEHPEQE